MADGPRLGEPRDGHDLVDVFHHLRRLAPVREIFSAAHSPYSSTKDKTPWPRSWEDRPRAVMTREAGQKERGKEGDRGGV